MTRHVKGYFYTKHNRSPKADALRAPLVSGVAPTSRLHRLGNGSAGNCADWSGSLEVAAIIVLVKSLNHGLQSRQQVIMRVNASDNVGGINCDLLAYCVGGRYFVQNAGDDCFPSALTISSSYFLWIAHGSGVCEVFMMGLSGCNF